MGSTVVPPGSGLSILLMMSAMSTEISMPDPKSDGRFAFGRNWSRFLSHLSESRIQAAEDSLRRLFGRDDLQGTRFLDAGSGSGLFSLAAIRLGAKVVSFDADADSVACGEELRRRFDVSPSDWTVLPGSLLDRGFMKSLGTFDVVYCWGVAHHTGQMWAAIDNLAEMVSNRGLLTLAIYNDELYVSRIWRGVKRAYQRLPGFLRPLFVALVGAWLFAKRFATTLLAAALRLATLRNPFVPFMNWARESQARGMHAWYDLVDWVGGWPFETARPEEVFRFLRDRGFVLRELTTSPGHGCNEFVFVRIAQDRP